MIRTAHHNGFQKGNKVGHRFKKGEVNSHGRPPTVKCIPDILRSIGDRVVDPFLLTQLHGQYGPNHNPKTMREAMLMAASVDAAKGDAVARAFVAERTEGKVTDQIKLDGGHTVVHEHNLDFSKMDITDLEKLRAMLDKATRKDEE